MPLLAVELVCNFGNGETAAGVADEDDLLVGVKTGNALPHLALRCPVIGLHFAERFQPMREQEYAWRDRIAVEPDQPPKQNENVYHSRMPGTGYLKNALTRLPKQHRNCCRASPA